MSYSIMVANGDAMTECRIIEVERVVVQDNVYILYNKADKVLFSAPVDSLVYLTAE